MRFDLDSGPHCLYHGIVFGGGAYYFKIKALSKPTVILNKHRGSFNTVCTLIWVLDTIVFYDGTLFVRAVAFCD